MSKILTINAAEDAVTIAVPTVSDILTTAASTTQVLTGLYGLAQRGGFFLAGMVTQNIRNGNGWNVFNKA